MAGTMGHVEIEPEAAEELAAAFRGELVRPGDPSYEEHRKVWNGSIDRHPALIARCAGVADVIAAVKLARRTGLRVAVRSGGHSFPGLSVCDGGLVIDLSLMKGIRVDPHARTARAQAGVLVAKLDRETQALLRYLIERIANQTVAGNSEAACVRSANQRLALSLV